ncbi:MAG: ribosome recycling factor [Longimicrobiales bacterium]
MPTIAEARAQMDRAIEALRREFAAVRTGKATPTLMDTVRVEAYGAKMPLNQVATVSAPEPRLIVIQPWDKGLIKDIERAIMEADLGLNPANDGTLVRVPVPPMTEERRKDMVKVLHKLAEEGRVAVRHARQEANKQIKQRQQDHELSEDDARRQLDQVQKLTDEHVEKIDRLLEAKEQEVMEV